MKRALVLGGGGSVGIGWETGIVAGLLDCGLDARDADLFIGTSAGSVVATHLAHGQDPRQNLRDITQQRGEAVATQPRPNAEHSVATFQLWTSFDRMTPEACAQVGHMALQANTIDEDRWVQSFGDTGFPGWPERPLLIVAVDCESGERVAWSKDDGVPIERALAASCSVPALFPPVAINGRRYTDGGVHSGTSADLALRIEPDVVLIVATIGSLDRGIHRLAAKDIPREQAQLEAAGATVHVVMFDDAAKQAVGPNLMDPARRIPAAEAGYEQGRRIADALRETWA